jgi:hypothetical protein
MDLGERAKVLGELAARGVGQADLECECGSWRGPTSNIDAHNTVRMQCGGCGKKTLLVLQRH